MFRLVHHVVHLLKRSRSMAELNITWWEKAQRALENFERLSYCLGDKNISWRDFILFYKVCDWKKEISRMAITSYINSFKEKSTIISHFKKNHQKNAIHSSIFFSMKLKIIFIDLNRPGDLAAFVRVEVSVTFLRYTADKKILCYLKPQLLLMVYRRKSKTPLSCNQGFWFSGKWLCLQHPLFSS